MISQQLLLSIYLGIIAGDGTHYILMVRAGVFFGFDICDQSIRHSDQRRWQALIYLKGSDSNTEHILQFFALPLLVCISFSMECYKASSVDPLLHKTTGGHPRPVATWKTRSPRVMIRLKLAFWN
jgi:hypothetical protein